MQVAFFIQIMISRSKRDAMGLWRNGDLTDKNKLLQNYNILIYRLLKTFRKNTHTPILMCKKKSELRDNKQLARFFKNKQFTYSLFRRFLNYAIICLSFRI